MTANACSVLPRPISSQMQQRPSRPIAKATPSRWNGRRRGHIGKKINGPSSLASLTRLSIRATACCRHRADRLLTQSAREKLSYGSHSFTILLKIIIQTFEAVRGRKLSLLAHFRSPLGRQGGFLGAVLLVLIILCDGRSGARGQRNDL